MWQYNELYHHGIKGQKWGVRRYQNEDGTLTEAGKKRYGEVGIDYKLKSSEYYAERKRLHSNYSKSDEGRKRLKEIDKEVNEIINDPKAKFDLDDGGGYDDKDTYSAKKASRYMELEEERSLLEDEIDRRATAKAATDLVKKYGEKRVKAIQTATAVKAGAAAVAGMSILLSPAIIFPILDSKK